MIAARPSRGLFIPGSVCWSTKRVNEPNAKGGDYANRATNVFSPAFVARARRLSALPEWYAAWYDQAGLMVRQNAENWMKCGTEFFDGQRHASVVFTRDFPTGPACQICPRARQFVGGRSLRKIRLRPHVRRTAAASLRYARGTGCGGECRNYVRGSRRGRVPGNV